MWVDAIQSVEALNRAKRLTFARAGGHFLLPDCLELGNCLFPALRLELKHQQFLGLEPASLGPETTTQLTWGSGLQMAELGTCQPP